MKKIISTILVCVLLVGSIFALASCGLSGTYKAKSGVTLTFDGDQATFGMGDSSIAATFATSVEEDQKYISFTWAEGASVPSWAESFEGKFKYSEGKDDDGKYIKIVFVPYITEVSFYKQ